MVKNAPTPVKVAFWIWMLTAVLGIINGIMLLVGNDAANTPDLTAEAKQAVSAIVSGSAVVAIIFSVIMAVVAWQMQKGKNWARLVLAIVGILSIISGLFSLTSGATVLGIVSLILAIIAVVFMYLKESNGYFRGMSAR